MNNKLKILIGYSYYSYPWDIKEWVEAWAKRLEVGTGYEIDTFCLTLYPPGPRLTWQELDKKWKDGDRRLLEMYSDLSKLISNYDVFINWNGINLHPEYVKNLPVYTVYGCFDDPESSEDLSKPVANYYDLCMIGNVAEIDTYKSWGVKNVDFWPMGFLADEYNPNLTEHDILNKERTNDIVFLGERETGFRAERFDKYSAAFPQGAFYGKGWKSGFYPAEKKVELFQNSKIGVNFHNSTGPINFRTYNIPANGVMLLCDNKKHLGKIYELGSEAVGFDTVEEAIELTKYYLEHEEERKRIAVAGWKRVMKDYNEIAVFQRVINRVLSDKYFDNNSQLIKVGTERMEQYHLDLLELLNRKYSDTVFRQQIIKIETLLNRILKLTPAKVINRLSNLFRKK